MPKIAAATVAENREQRQHALLTAAASLLTRDGTFTMAEVAKEVGLSRTAVYEYYASVPELVADVLIGALEEWTLSLAAATEPGQPWRNRLHAWITGVLEAAADGRHALLERASALDLPTDRRREVRSRHEALIAPVVDSLVDAGVREPATTARYIWALVQVAMTRIETKEVSLNEATDSLLQFIDSALRTPEEPTP